MESNPFREKVSADLEIYTGPGCTWTDVSDVPGPGPERSGVVKKEGLFGRERQHFSKASMSCAPWECSGERGSRRDDHCLANVSVNSLGDTIFSYR